MVLRLEELSVDNLGDVLRLPPQAADDEPVAPTVWSVAEAYVRPTAWPRAVTDDGAAWTGSPSCGTRPMSGARSSST
jgi:diamine N-acetyltransferase